MKKNMAKLGIALFIGAMGMQTYVSMESRIHGNETLDNIEALASGEVTTRCTPGAGFCFVGGSFVEGLTIED